MDRKRRMMSAQSTSVTQQLMDGAPFVAQLTKTLALQRGTGSATFTRATTGSVQDHEGKLRTAIAGEARFTGARRVRNLLPSTEGAFDAGAGWTVLNGTVTPNVSDPNGGTSAYTLRQTGASSCELYPTTPFSGSVLSSVWLRRRTGTGTISLYGGDTVTNITASVTSEWQRIPSHPTNSSAVGFDLRLFDANDEVDFWHPQAEDTTGRADQTTPSEYVSVGVESAPYHGAGVDGVKYFDTDISGNPLTTLKGYSAEGARTNLCLQSNAFTTTWTNSPALGTLSQNVVGPDGAVSAWTCADTDAANASRLYQLVTLTAAAYTASLFVKKTSGATAFPVIALVTGTVYGLATLDTNSGVATAWTSNGYGTTLVGVSARCTSFNSDFWRFELTATGTAAAYTYQLYPAGTTNPTQSTGIIDAAVTGSAVFYGAQVELGSFASSYIPTTTIAVARNADIDSTTASGNITAAAGSVYFEFTPTHSPSGTIAFWGTYVDASNYTAILHDATNLIFRKRIAGVNYDATIANAFVSGTTYKACGTWGAAGVTITLNGTDGTPSADTTAAQIAATMQWGADGNSLQQPFASVRNCRDWLRQLSSSERRAITA